MTHHPMFTDPDDLDPYGLDDVHDDATESRTASAPPLDSEREAAELVRLLLDLDDIASGALLLVVCDDERRPVVPLVVTDLPPTAAAPEVVGRWLAGMAEQLDLDGGGIVMARARAGHGFVLDHDRAWHEAILAACAQAPLSLLHAFVVTPHAVVPFPEPLSPGNG